MCCDVQCKDRNHTNTIDVTSKRLINSCITAGDHCFPLKPQSVNHMPCWSKEVAHLRTDSLFWHAIWRECGKPNTGEVACIMHSTRAKYHRAMRRLKQNELSNRKARIAEANINNDPQTFWKEISKMSRNKSSPTPVVDNCFNSQEICDVFWNKYTEVYNSVPTCKSELTKLLNNIENKICLDNNPTIVSVAELTKLLNKLKPGKSDGFKNTKSEHYIYASQKFKVILCMLFQSMLVHGHMPEDLTRSVIVSIPKDKGKDLSNSSNYRGIALCDALAKLFDIWILHKYSETLSTSDYQFAFKQNHSTVLCTSVLKEIISYYTNNGSSVYVCLLDASRAFDRIHFGKLFHVLLDKGLPAIVIRVLLDCYTNQNVYCRWNSILSSNIETVNGVRQGAILSPVLFCIYIDILLKELSNQDVGCRIGNTFVGALAYADDVTLLSPSIGGLQKLVSVCENFGSLYHVKFNSRKTVCIAFNQQENIKRNISVCDASIPWSNRAKHLGNTLVNNLDDSEDILNKRGNFVLRINKILANFGHLNSSVLKVLMTSFCTSLYGCQTWNLTCSSLKKLYISWNKAVRKIWKLSNLCHTNILPYLMQSLYISEQLVCRFAKLIDTMKDSDNKIILMLYRLACNNATGNIGSNIAYISFMYDLNVVTLEHARIMNQLKINSCNFTLQNTAAVISELCDVRDLNYIIPGIEPKEIMDMIYALTVL